MHEDGLLQLLPTLEMIAEAFTSAGREWQGRLGNTHKTYRGVRMYRPGLALQPDLLYIVDSNQTDFPADTHSYIAAGLVPGEAEHLCVSGGFREEILEFLLDLFSRFQTQQIKIDELVYGNASLQELCALGSELLENPVFIHDDWFVMIATSPDIDHVMVPEYVADSAKSFVPQMIIEDFKHDRDYLETFAAHTPQLWKSVDNAPDSLYVNLWEGEIYRGRFLVIQHQRQFRSADYAIAAVLAQRAVLLMDRKQLGSQEQGQRTDQIVFQMLQGKQADAAQLHKLLTMVGWGKTDRLLCMRIRFQQPEVPPMLEHVLHNDLFRQFPGSYVMFTQWEQCVILNLQKAPLTLSQIHHQLAPLCRDYCLYAGLSSPVVGVRDLHLAYYEAEIALNQAFALRSEKWILFFSDCALSHMINTLRPPLQPWHLVSPDLMALKEHDEQHGTEYLETFRQYLLLERDIPKTSQALIIHRTTLLYRLKKIQALIQSDLEDPWQRLYLLLSFRILEGEKQEGGS